MAEPLFAFQFRVVQKLPRAAVVSQNIVEDDERAASPGAMSRITFHSDKLVVVVFVSVLGFTVLGFVGSDYGSLKRNV